LQLMEITSKDIQVAETLLAIVQKGTYEVKGDSIALLADVLAAQSLLIQRLKASLQNKDYINFVPAPVPQPVEESQHWLVKEVNKVKLKTAQKSEKPTTRKNKK
jgi:hypothetical protein